MTKRTKQAFTLVELLVVVAIIGILAAIGVVAVGDARVRARDAKKMADISQLRSALEAFYGDAARYPTIAGHNVMINGQCLSRGANFSDCPSASGTRYMVVPPGVSNGYRYINVGVGNGYEVEFYLEKETGGYAAGLRKADSTGIR